MSEQCFQQLSNDVLSALTAGRLILQKQLSHSLSLQEHTKKQILIRPDTHYRGYQQLGANVTRYEDGYQRDWHEAIDLYRERSPQVMHFFPQQHPASYFTYSTHCFRQLAAP